MNETHATRHGISLITQFSPKRTSDRRAGFQRKGKGPRKGDGLGVGDPQPTIAAHPEKIMILVPVQDRKEAHHGNP
jgi:hypothetical protein